MASSKPPTLLNLPVELRIQIYRAVFEGSRVIFKPRSRRDKTRSVRQGQSDAFTTTNQWPILLTCRQCYNEGREVFWEETRLHGGDPDDLFSADYLATAISKFTREHVQHLRCIFHQSVGRVLERFAISGLKTLEIHFQPLGYVTAEVWDKLDDYDTFTQKVLPRALRIEAQTGGGVGGGDGGYSSPVVWQRWLEARDICLPSDSCCTFLMQLRARTCVIGSDEGVDQAQRTDCSSHEHLGKLMFFNLNTGKLFVALESSVESEDGFGEIL